MTKKVLALLLVLVFSAGFFAACTPETPGNTDGTSEESTNKISEEIPMFEKIYHEGLSVEDPFEPEKIRVSLQPYTYRKKYSTDSFTDIGCESITLETVQTIQDSETGLLYPYYVYELVLIEKTKENVIQAIRTLEQREDILSAEVIEPPLLNLLPNDPHFTSSFQWGITKIDLPSAWDITTGATGENTIKVGIIDTGVTSVHPDLDDGQLNLLGASSMSDFCGHGTHVAGVIGTTANNGEGIAGICWNVEIVVF